MSKQIIEIDIPDGWAIDENYVAVEGWLPDEDEVVFSIKLCAKRIKVPVEDENNEY